KVKKVNDEVEIEALVDGKRVNIKESFIGHILRLDDADGTSCLTNTKIFEGLSRMGYEKPSDKLTFYKAFFSPQWKFLIHNILQCLSTKTTSWNEFVQLIINHQLGIMTHYKDIFDTPSLTKKVFANMKRVVDSDELVMKKEESSKQGRRIADIDAHFEINLEKVQAEAYNLDLDHQEKVVSMLDVNNEESAGVEEVVEVVTTTKLITKVVTTAGVDVNVASVQDTSITTAEATKVTVEVPKPRKGRGVIIQDPVETTTKVTVQPKVQAKDKGKAILIEEPKPLKRQVQIGLYEEVARQLEAKLKANINWNALIKQVKRSERLTNAVMKYQALKRKPLINAQARRNMIVYLKNIVNEGIKVPKKEVRQEKEVEIESSKRKDATPLASNIPIVDYKIQTERNRPYFKIIRADGDHRLFMSFSTMMKNFDREDLESLWKIVRERLEKTEPKNYTYSYLPNTLKIMFEKPNVEASIYPLTHFTLEKMVDDVRLEVDYESKMSLELLRLVRRQLNEGLERSIHIKGFTSGIRACRETLSSTGSSSSTHNVAFVSSDNTSSTNKVNTTYDISTSFGHNSQMRPAKQDESKAMVTIDGKGIDWTSHAEDDTKDYALMAFNSSNSGSDTESKSSESDAKTSDLAYRESTSSVETLESVPKPVKSKPKAEYSNAKTLQQNGVAERKNRTLIKAARTMLADSFLPNTFWAEAVSTACYVLNRPVTAENKANKTAGPKEANNSAEAKNGEQNLNEDTSSKTNKEPVYQGDQAFLEELDRLKRQENEANDAAAQGTKDLLLQAGAARASSTNYVNATSTTVNTAGTHINTASSSRNDKDVGLSSPDLLTYANQDDSQIPNLEDIYEVPNDGIFTNASYDTKGAMDDFTNLESTVNGRKDEKFRVVIQFEDLMFFIIRIEGYIWFVFSKTEKFRQGACIQTGEDKKAKTRLNIKECNFNKLDDLVGEGADYVVNKGKSTNKIKVLNAEAEGVSAGGETLSTATLAVSTAMHEELLRFKLQEVWTLVDLLKGKRAIGTKWVFRNKKDEKGIMIRNKARLVTQRYTQEEGINYDEVFSPVARIEAFMLFLAYASFLMVYQMDVKSAFLYQKIEEEVRMMAYLLFKKYVVETLKRFGFTEVKNASTHMETQKPLLKDEDEEEVDVHMYRLMIGSLMYLTSSRPNIMFVVCACARYQVNLKVSHLYAIKRIFRYLKGQPKLGLWYPKDSPFDLVAYTDSDYAGASLDRKSTTGGC
nr:hypothetical protein [Tanacetum cinerariifolium]